MLDTSARLLALLVPAAVPARLARLGARRPARRERAARSATTSTGCASSATPSTRCAARPGHYRLGAGAKLPPLLLDDDEAVAVASACGRATGVAGIEETSARALAKLEQVLPHRLRRRSAPCTTRLAGPDNTGDATSTDPEVDPALLTDARRRRPRPRRVRFAYRDGERAVVVEPYRLVSWQRRWYLVARDAGPGEWRDLPRRLDDPADADARAGSRPGRCREGTTRRSCCATSRRPAGRCTRGSGARARRARCSPASTPPSASSSPRRRHTACWSPAPTASRSSPSTSGCSAWTSR